MAGMLPDVIVRRHWCVCVCPGKVLAIAPDARDSCDERREEAQTRITITMRTSQRGGTETDVVEHGEERAPQILQCKVNQQDENVCKSIK